jgi:hypothetical protein
LSKVQCAEQGVTGLRETFIVEEAVHNGTAQWDETGFMAIGGWSFDDEQFDERFPDHPSSRVRKELRLIAAVHSY